MIQLDHGKCDRCYNCHLISDRNKCTANDGSGIMPANVEKLCSRCHGLIYNDWQSGTHGVCGAVNGRLKQYLKEKLWEKVSEEGKLTPEQHIEMMNKMIQYMSEKVHKGKDW